MNTIFRLFVLALFIQTSVEAQVQNYAKSVVNTLASDSLYGRGYVNDGDKKAADFIRNEFEKFGLTPLGDNYFQNFETSVNTFPNSISLKINGQQLVAGKDFLIDASSGPRKGNFKLISFSTQDLLSDQLFNKKLRESLGNMIIIENYDPKSFSDKQAGRLKAASQFLKRDPRSPAVGFVEIKEKLTWSGSTFQSDKTGIYLLEGDITKKIENIEIEFISEFKPDYKTQNVTGLVKGKNSDSTIVFMAHYDHLGMMGPNAIFNGANDNASGTAMLLSMAKYYSENKPEYDMAFLAFGAEELGLVGSKYFIENPLINLSSVKFFFNFDIAGTGDEGIQVVNGSVYRSQFDSLKAINERTDLLPQVKIRGAACNSDHCLFDQQEIPGFYIYTLGGIQAYHDVYDRPETLPLTEFEDYFKLLTLFIDQL